MVRNTFHVALYVSDIESAVQQYHRILGVEPAKVRPDYAKFEIADPPTILSLNLGGTPGTLSHLGIRYPSTGDVASEKVRTRNAGYVDVAWAGLMAAAALFAGLVGEGDDLPRTLVALFGGLWGARLCLHLLHRDATVAFGRASGEQQGSGRGKREGAETRAAR